MSVPPSGMAWIALSSRFKKSCLSRLSSPTRGTASAISVATSTPCLRARLATRPSDWRSTSAASNGTNTASRGRAKESRPSTISLIRSTSSSRPEASSRPGWSAGRVSWRYWMVERIAVNGFLISWAAPAASSPATASRSAR